MRVGDGGTQKTEVGKGMSWNLRNASDDASTSKDEEGGKSRVGLDKGENAGHDCVFLFLEWRVGEECVGMKRRKKKKGEQSAIVLSPFIRTQRGKLAEMIRLGKCAHCAWYAG